MLKIFKMNPIDCEEKLKQFIKDNNVQAKHIHFSTSVHTVEEAAREANAEPDDFVKSICMIGEQAIVAIVLGTDRASIERVGKVVGKRPHVASPEEALIATGYPVGGTPPFGYDAIFIVDESVLSKDIVYAGGGSPQALIRISPQEILRINSAKIARVRK